MLLRQVASILCFACFLSYLVPCNGLQQAAWKSCASSAAAFDIQNVDLQPDTVPQGGSLSLVMSVYNKLPQVIAGLATVKVYYYGWWVLTASGTMCDHPQAPAVAAAAAAASTPPAATAVSSSHQLVAHRRALSSVSSSRSSWMTSTWLATGLMLGSSTQQTHASSSSRTSPIHPNAARDTADTCTLLGGPLQLYHQASLPAVAPRGSYSMRLSAQDAANGQELMCVDVWFKVA